MTEQIDTNNYQEEIEELLEEEFNPDLFYRALTNALEQLEHFDEEAA